jgi:hypothetical protein
MRLDRAGARSSAATLHTRGAKLCSTTGAFIDSSANTPPKILGSPSDARTLPAPIWKRSHTIRLEAVGADCSGSGTFKKRPRNYVVRMVPLTPELAGVNVSTRPAADLDWVSSPPVDSLMCKSTTLLAAYKQTSSNSAQISVLMFPTFSVENGKPSSLTARRRPPTSKTLPGRETQPPARGPASSPFVRAKS